MSNSNTAGSFRFGRFVLQPVERRLLDDGNPVALEPRTLDLLIALVERAGRLATKDELLDRIWPGKIVEEANLHVHVSSLRKVLDAGTIATVAGHGYRFTESVRHVDGETSSPIADRNNLPHPLDSFIGREDDLLLLAQGLERARLLTLTGIGGAGKTRLAIRLAECVAPSFPDGVCFVDLAPVAEGERVARAVATALDVREEADKPIAETLLRHLAGRRRLLVLDNCEHLVDACATLTGRLLAAASQLHILVTSRERLDIAGEWVMPVRSLTLPPPGTDADAHALAGFESVRLFVERAQRAAPEFELGPHNAAAVGEICRRLDGIPLALELAAARMMLLSVEQIRAGLDDRFRLLAGNSRTISRHRTLLVTLESSYDSLAQDERQCLQHLSVFAGGWTLDAATAVTGHGDDIATMRTLGRLVDTSLVLVDRIGPAGPRYRMLETVRQFTQEKLEESGTGNETRERHLAHFVRFAVAAQAGLLSPAMREWLPRIDAELPNLLAAHAWCDHATDGAHQGLLLATNLRSYWLGRGLFAFGQRVYQDALARTGGDPRSMLRGRTLYAFGQHHYVRGRLHDVLAPTQEALAIARAHEDDEQIVYCLDRICLASCWLGDSVRARECCEEELRVANRSGNRRLLGFALTAQGGVCRAEGDLDAAASAYERALALFEQGDDLNNRYNTLVDVARVSIARAHPQRARETLAAAIRLIGEMGTLYRGHFALEATSRLAAACAHWSLAARLQGASDAVVDRMGGTRTWFDDPVLAALHAKPAASLGAEVHAAAYDRGRNLMLEVALAEAAAWLEEPGALSR